ncbi:MAG: hypothetical protein CMH83_11270 [Nocardioides sp.]|nr:hypothetical protein [Nocardioides sp.]
MPPANPRPPQTTLIGWMVGAGSAAVVVACFQQVASLGSARTQEAATDFIDRLAGSGVGAGLTVDDVQGALRVAALVTAAAATMTAILAVRLVRSQTPDRSTRVAITVGAVVLLVVGSFVAGLMSFVVAAAATMLWTQPSRGWFAGRPWVPPGVRAAPGAPGAPGSGSAAQPTTQHAAAAYPPPSGGQQPGGQQAGPWAPPYAAPPAPARRPGQVVAASVITLVFCGLGLLVAAIMAVTVATSSEDLVAEVQSQQPELVDAGLTESTVVVAGYVVSAGLGLWSVLAGALAILALVGHRWAAIALVSSTGGIAVLSLLATLTSAAAGLPLIAAVLVVTLMLRPEVRTWYAARAHERALARRR